jgi:hypothetical protein
MARGMAATTGEKRAADAELAAVAAADELTQGSVEAEERCLGGLVYGRADGVEVVARGRCCGDRGHAEEESAK